MYGRIKQKPLTKTNEPLTCESIRQELEQYIDNESRRVNVDSAKKRAVLQHMDYEGFRQMVLGANLFSVKSSQLNKFSGGLLDGPTQKIFNVLVTNQKTKQIKPNLELIKISQNQTQYMPMYCNSFNQFKKRFLEYFKLPLEQSNVAKLYQLLKDQDQPRLLKIFNSDFDPSYFGKICQVLVFIMRNHVLKEKDVNQYLYISKFLQTVVNIKTFGMLVLDLLSKKQKSILKQLLGLIQESSDKQEQAIQISKLYQKYIN